MTTGGEDEIMAAFDAAYGSDPELVELAKPAKRKAAEKRMALRPDDGRRKRATGRTVQFNVNMRPEIKEQIIKAARQADMSITVWIEQAALAYLETKERA
jgi:hypothetical protein